MLSKSVKYSQSYGLNEVCDRGLSTSANFLLSVPLSPLLKSSVKGHLL